MKIQKEYGFYLNIIFPCFLIDYVAFIVNMIFTHQDILKKLTLHRYKLIWGIGRYRQDCHFLFIKSERRMRREVASLTEATFAHRKNITIG